MREEEFWSADWWEDDYDEENFVFKSFKCEEI